MHKNQNHDWSLAPSFISGQRMSTEQSSQLQDAHQDENIFIYHHPQLLRQ